jgi:hypothetical protein
MDQVKEMPYNEKYQGVLSYVNILEDFAPRLVKDELGETEEEELREIWKKESEPIPKDASDKERYEIAYRNFIRNWVSAHNFMKQHQGEDGTKKFMQAAIGGWRERFSGQALKLRIVGGVSRKTAFRSLAKQLAYKLQVFSPFVVTELTENRMLLKVDPCKIPGMPSGSEFCMMACQNIIPVWLERQFNIKMSSTRHGPDCEVTFEHF